MEGLNFQQVVVLVTLVVAIILWVSELIPLYVTALLSSFMLITVSGFSAKEIFAHYFDPIIVLFLGGFLLARAMEKHGLNDYLISKLLSRASTNPYYFVLTLMLITAFMSMWMSNTASAAVMIPICLNVIAKNRLMESSSGYAKAMILGVSYAATLGGIATVIGTAPNAIALKYINENGLEVSFLGWMAKATPFVILCLLASWLVIMKLNKPKVEQIIFNKIDQTNITGKQIGTLVIFGITVLGWLTSKITGLSSSLVAVVPIVLLSFFKLLKEEDLNKISWPTLLLFGGGLALGWASNEVGLDKWIVASMQDSLVHVPLLLKLFLLGFFGILITMFASNTASAAVLVPLTLPLAEIVGISPMLLIMFVAISTSLDFMIPVGTPPSAIAYSTGLIRVKEMVKNGVLINITTGILLVLYFYLLEVL